MRAARLREVRDPRVAGERRTFPRLPGSTRLLREVWSLHSARSRTTSPGTRLMPTDRVRAILPPDTAATWDAIAPIVPPEAYLGGGTAIAVHLAHRISRDLDFFFHHDSIDLDELARGLTAVGSFAITERSPGTLNGLFSATKVQFLHPEVADITERLERIERAVTVRGGDEQKMA